MPEQKYMLNIKFPVSKELLELAYVNLEFNGKELSQGQVEYFVEAGAQHWLTQIKPA